MFIALLVQSIQSMEPQAKVLQHPIFRPDEIKSVISKFAKRLDGVDPQQNDVNDTPIDALKTMFGVHSSEHTKNVTGAVRRRNEIKVFYETRRILTRLLKNSLDGYMPIDFASEEAYNQFKSRHMGEIQEILNTFVEHHPNVMRVV